MSLIVTGSIGIDTVLTPTGRADEILGGSAVYFAAAASFFCPVRLVAAVGEDCPPAFLDTFRRFNIDLAGLEQRKGSKTFRWTGKYHDNLNIRDTVDVQLNILGESQPPVPAGYRDSRYVFLANTDPASQMHLLSQFPNRKLAIADTMDLWINTQRGKLLELLKQIDGLVLNDSEAVNLTGQTNLILAAREVAKLGPRVVVIKKGEHGCLLHHPEGTVALPAYPADKVVDPTGAGDSFAGGMLGVLASTGQTSLAGYKQAVAAGTVVASYTIEAFSLNRLTRITRSDIDSRLMSYRDMLRID
ncbi:MAG: sugar kinase [Phycisphaeraceae bacterium]|nr:sugar kinase [Phycisphaeraceae bacterium]